MYLNLKSWLKGFAMGLAGKPLDYDIKYLYNGIVFPQLPNWDKEAMPYALIYTKKGEEGFYNLVASATRIYRISSGFQSGNGQLTLWANTGDRWNKTMSGENTVSLDKETYDVIWTNTDITETAGTLYLAASDPEPAIIRGYKYGTYVAPLPPDYDSILYPYAFVTNYNDAVLYHYSSRPFHGTDGIQPRENCVKGTFRLDTGKWIAAQVPTSYDAYTITAYNPIWANYSILKDDSAYLYNGIRLPALPEHDAKYKYAYIDYNADSDTATLTLTSSAFTSYYVAETGRTWVHTEHFSYPDCVYVARYSWAAGGTAWTLVGETTPQELSGTSLPTWTNTKIVDDDSGDITLAASDPIPDSVLLAETKLVPVYYGQPDPTPTSYSYNGVILPEESGGES